MPLNGANLFLPAMLVACAFSVYLGMGLFSVSFT